MKYTHLLIAAAALSLSACQSLSTTPTQSPSEPVHEPAFSITGKIGVTTITPQGAQANSAFYGWSQQNGRFSIDLTGALGLGATTIRYDGQHAELNSEKTGIIQADSPEALLVKATGWHAPISQLPYWIVGKNAPSDDLSQNQQQGNRLTHAVNGGWTADFEYARQAMPSRLRIVHSNGHRVVMTINAQ